MVYSDRKDGSVSINRGAPSRFINSQHCFGNNVTPYRLISAVSEDSTAKNFITKDYQKELFTVEQDLFIVAHRCFENPTEPSVLQTKFLQKFSIQKSAHDLEYRLQELSQDGLKYLLKLYIQENIDNKGVYSEILPKYSEFAQVDPEDSLVSEITSVDYTLCDLGDVRVEVQGSEFKNYSTVVPMNDICDVSVVCSEIIKGHQDTSTRNDSIMYYPSYGIQPARLSLTDKTSYYRNRETFNHLDRPIFERMMKFARDNKVYDRMLYYKKQYNNARQQFENCSESIDQIFQREKLKFRKKILEQEELEVNNLNMLLEEALDKDIKAIQEMHRKTLDQEKNKIKAIYMEKQFESDNFFEEQKNNCLQIYHKEDNKEIGKLERKLIKATSKVEEIFDSGEHFLRLLLLSEDLECDKLRNACIHYLSEKGRILQFMLKREFTSPLLSDSTAIHIFQQLCNEDLREIESFGVDFHYHILVTREIHRRRILLAKDLRKVSNNQLRDAMQFGLGNTQSSGVLLSQDKEYRDKVTSLASSISCFPTILQAEIKRRTDFSNVKINTELLPSYMSISEDSLAVQVEKGHRYATAIATQSRSAGQFGKWMFEVSIENMDENGGHIAIGWDVLRNTKTNMIVNSDRTLNENTEQNIVIPGVHPGVNKNDYGIIWQGGGNTNQNSVGIVYADGKAKSGYSSFGVGDVIACAIDQDSSEPNVKFFLNGLQAVPQLSRTNPDNALSKLELNSASLFLKKFKARKAPEENTIASINNGIAITNHKYSFYPAVCLYSSRHGSTARVRFNFKGHFKYNIKGYEPYGAVLSDLVHYTNVTR